MTWYRVASPSHSPDCVAGVVGSTSASGAAFSGTRLPEQSQVCLNSTWADLQLAGVLGVGESDGSLKHWGSQTSLGCGGTGVITAAVETCHPVQQSQV